MITVRLPRLLDSNLREAGRLHPVDGGLNLNMVPLSTASLDVLTKDTVPGGSWIEMYSPYGTAGIFRVTSVSSGYGSEISTLELEHAISEVGDSVVNAEISQEMGLNSAISTLWGYYKGSKWKLGSNSFSDRVLVDVMYDNLLQAILGVLDQTTGYMMAFDFSTSPWTLNIVRKGTAVAAEGRLSRNVQEATVTVDRTEQCTRVYMDYDSDEGSGGTLSVDADNISQYEVIESHQTGSGYTYDQAYAVAKDYVEKHKNPAITVSITGLDFAKVTGESLDVLEVGKLYRLAIPKYRVVVEENITSLNWSHLYTDPTSVEVVLGPEQDKVVSYMHTTTESISRGGKGTVKKQGRYWTRFERTDHYIDQVAAYTDENGNILKQAGMYIDANGVLQYAQDNERQIGSQFKVAADRISAEVAKREEGERTLYSNIEQTATRIRTEVVNVKSGLESSITQTASQIRSEVASTKAGLESSITQTASQIRSEVASTKSGLESSITQTASQIRSEVKSTKEGLETQIKQNKDSIELRVKKGDVATQLAVEAGNVSVRNGNLIVDGMVTAAAVKAAAAEITDLTVGGVVRAQHFYLGTGALPTAMIDSGTYDLRITQSGNTYTLQKQTFSNYEWQDVGSFSRATTLGVEYGGDNTGDTATFTVTASPQGNTATGTFKVKQSKTAAYVTDPNGTIRARIDNPQYGNGWNAAYGKVSLPTASSTANNFSVSTPPSTVDGAAVSTTYTLSNPQNDVAVVKNPAGTIVARLEHGKYTAGYTQGKSDGYDEYYPITYTEIDGGSVSWDSGSISGRKNIGSISRPDARSYIKFSISCRGTTRKFYITVN